MNEETDILVLKTVQAPVFKVLIEALKDILSDANFIFDKSGVKLMGMDNTHTVLVCMTLNAKRFEFYKCNERQTVGINMMHFYKLMKTMSNQDTLTFKIIKEQQNLLGVCIENQEKNTSTSYKINLMDLQEENFEIPPVTFDSVITMPSNDFQKILRDMHYIADYVEIKCFGDSLIFSCKGEYASQETVVGTTVEGLRFTKKSKDDTNIVQGVFNLKHLVLFTKCTNLSNSVEIFLKNDYPLITKYSVANLGHIKMCLAPQCSTNILTA